MVGVGVPAIPRAPLRTPATVVEVLRPIMEGRLQEVLIVLHLDGRHHLIGWEEVAKGSANVVHVSARDIFRSALAVNAVAIIVSHNHPSGSADPSPEDCDLTRRLRAAADLVGIPLLDHIVIGADGYYSFSDSRLVRMQSEPTTL